jgi:starch synthase (maltosyl-transferring)
MLVQSFLFHANVASRLAALFAGRPWVVGGLRVAERGKTWHRALDRLTARLSVGSVCVSDGVLRFSRDVGWLPADRLTVIPNGVDPTPFDDATPASRDALGIPPDAVVALFVGRIDVQKGVADLLDAAAKVAVERKDWHLVLVGDGPDLRKHRARTETDTRLARRVHWLGRRDDIAALLNAADLLVLPSLWEGMPNVVLEAMASRRAVVATDVEGSEDLVVPGRTGWLIPAGDPARLASALLEAHSDSERLRRYGDAAREWVDTHYSWASAIRAYEQLWARILGFDGDCLDGPGVANRS